MICLISGESEVRRIELFLKKSLSSSFSVLNSFLKLLGGLTERSRNVIEMKNVNTATILIKF